MTDGDLGWDGLIRGVRDGDAVALRVFFDRYGPALERLASRAIDPRMRRRFGPETVAQSVCRTFLRRAADDQFALTDGDGLWRLLCAIALTKVREKVRYHRRLKRGIDRETPLPGDGVRARGPTTEEEVEFADQLEHVLAQLDEEQRHLVELRLEELTQTEIAERMGCSERTVRRLLSQLETRLAGALLT